MPELLRGDPEQRRAAPDRARVGEVHRDADGGASDEPPGPLLQDPQLAGLEGELQMARIAMMLLDPVQGLQQAGPPRPPPESAPPEGPHRDDPPRPGPGPPAGRSTPPAPGRPGRAGAESATRPRRPPRPGRRTAPRRTGPARQCWGCG